LCLFPIMKQAMLAAAGCVERNTWRLLYFGAPTRGEQLRLLFRVAGVPFEDVRLRYPEGLAPLKSASLGDESPLMWDQCPTVLSPDDSAVSQVAACMQFVGRSCGRASSNGWEDAKSLSFVLGCEEVRNQVFYANLVPQVVVGVAQAKAGQAWAAFAWCTALLRLFLRLRRLKPFHAFCRSAERELRVNGAAHGGPFLFSSAEPLYPDVALFDVLDAITTAPYFVTPKDLDGYPCLRKHLSTMRSHPALADYLRERGSVVDAVVATVVG